jgi:hypothetical protein
MASKINKQPLGTMASRMISFEISNASVVVVVAAAAAATLLRVQLRASIPTHTQAHTRRVRTVDFTLLARTLQQTTVSSSSSSLWFLDFPHTRTHTQMASGIRANSFKLPPHVSGNEKFSRSGGGGAFPRRRPTAAHWLARATPLTLCVVSSMPDDETATAGASTHHHTSAPASRPPPGDRTTRHRPARDSSRARRYHRLDRRRITLTPRKALLSHARWVVQRDNGSRNMIVTGRPATSNRHGTNVNTPRSSPNKASLVLNYRQRQQLIHSNQARRRVKCTERNKSQSRPASLWLHNQPDCQPPHSASDSLIPTDGSGRMSNEDLAFCSGTSGKSANCAAC